MIDSLLGVTLRLAFPTARVQMANFVLASVSVVRFTLVNGITLLRLLRISRIGGWMCILVRSLGVSSWFEKFMTFVIVVVWCGMMRSVTTAFRENLMMITWLGASFLCLSIVLRKVLTLVVVWVTLLRVLVRDDLLS